MEMGTEGFLKLSFSDCLQFGHVGGLAGTVPAMGGNRVIRAAPPRCSKTKSAIPATHH
jgi:hypothetical protein